ncbi:MAG: hypothetical protein J5I90_08915 [Caldilineales bacterium]|nr:hypothetical protein [Caldilineales bacterium]
MDPQLITKVLTYIAAAAFVFLTAYTMKLRSQSGQPLNLAHLLLRPFSSRSSQSPVSATHFDEDDPDSSVV